MSVSLSFARFCLQLSAVVLLLLSALPCPPSSSSTYQQVHNSNMSVIPTNISYNYLHNIMPQLQEEANCFSSCSFTNTLRLHLSVLLFCFYKFMGPTDRGYGADYDWISLPTHKSTTTTGGGGPLLFCQAVRGSDGKCFSAKLLVLPDSGFVPDGVANEIQKICLNLRRCGIKQVSAVRLSDKTLNDTIDSPIENATTTFVAWASAQQHP
eukprot:GHVQ01034295.1.p2 GENE.GHVQ01034295.1~~GHVQ01034295.1.p2  ORF type:complete len:210 (+),score=41.87 GHVQ01034295.1:580-1209(+)